MSYLDAIGNTPVVIDNGSGLIKAGFAGDRTPKSIFPNFVGRLKHTRVMAGAGLDERDSIMGQKAEEHRGLLKIKYPMEHGIIDDWEDMESVWKFLFSKEALGVPSEDHPVLLTEAPLNPRMNRERVAEIFFESFNVPGLFVAIQAVLSLYASGRTTGVVVDCGDGVTYSVPIYEGFALRHSIIRNDVAGRDVTRYLQLLLRREGYAFHTSAEMEIVREIKERCCYIAMNPQKEEVNVDHASDPGEYTLPDGTVIEVGHARFKAPEALFHPELIGLEYPGIHETLVSTIMRSDLDLRKTLFANCVLSGGSTLFRPMGERILAEVKRVAPVNTHICISAPRERKYSTWIGGSILASLDTFKNMWVTKAEYAEEGNNALHRKTF